MKWSICLLSWNRFESLKKVWDQNIKRIAAVRDIEVLFCDQGSDPIQPIKDFVSSHSYVSYTRYNPSNEGVARSLNQLLARTKFENIAIMGNDILLPESWYVDAEQCFESVPKCGLVGWSCTMSPTLPAQDYGGIKAHPVNKGEAVFGNLAFKRTVLEDVGAFYEHYHPYGLEDSDYNFRVNIAGWNSVYVANRKSNHLGGDVGLQNSYRQMKDFSLQANSLLHERRARSYARFGYYVPFPPLT